MDEGPAPAYAELPEEAQIAGLRPVALTAARHFGLDVDQLTLVAHSFNTTFAVTTKQGDRFALRFNTGSLSSIEQVRTQQAWQVAIAAETPVLVPTPLRTTSGDWATRIHSEILGREVLVTCASWLLGSDVGDPSPEVARALGRAMARLHRHARGWWDPTRGSMPLFDEPFLGEVDSLAAATWLDTEQHAVLAGARELVVETFRRVYADAPVIPLHADLQGANLKWHEGRLAIFDFDDCGLGIPALDLATTTFYLRGEDPAREQALLQGYAELQPLPEIDSADFEALVASRQLLLAAVLLNSSTAGMRADAEAYSVTSVERLQRWLRTGRFSRVA